MRKKINEIGNRYGKLVVVEESHTKWRRYYWKCICDCGNYCIIDGAHLRRGHTKSCGCLHYSKETRQQISSTLKKFFSEGNHPF